MHSSDFPLENECALNVMEQVQVGMSVTFTEGGVERVSDLEEGDIGVVLSIDSTGSLDGCNVEVHMLFFI